MITPVNKYLLIKIEVEPEVTANGLYMPQGSSRNATDILKCGEVLAIGENVENIAVGSKVYYNKHAITNIPDQSELILVRYEDIYAVVAD